MMCIQQVAPSMAAVTALSDPPCGQSPSDAKGGARCDLSSDSKQFNSNVNGLAPRSHPPFWLQFPAAATLSASADQTVGRVDQFNRRSDRL